MQEQITRTESGTRPSLPPYDWRLLGSVVVTGAQLFDPWFEREPSTGRDEFLARVGLGSGPYVLYVGSSRNITRAKHEIAFVRRMVEDHVAARRDWSTRLWALLCLELWFREFVD